MKISKRTVLAIALLVLAAALIYTGAARGELPFVFRKAVKICLECIGLG